MDKVLIDELQDHFDARGKLRNAVVAIKSYTKDTSVFFSYKDGWNNKKYINLQIDPEDILPILERYIDNIDKDIERISTPKAVVTIDNFPELDKYLYDYKSRFPQTFTSLEKITETLRDSYNRRKNDNERPGSEEEEYHIPVCSDWEDKLYVFSLLGECNGSIFFQFEEIVKL